MEEKLNLADKIRLQRRYISIVKKRGDQKVIEEAKKDLEKLERKHSSKKDN